MPPKISFDLAESWHEDAGYAVINIDRIRHALPILYPVSLSIVTLKLVTKPIDYSG